MMEAVSSFIDSTTAKIYDDEIEWTELILGDKKKKTKQRYGSLANYKEEEE